MRYIRRGGPRTGALSPAGAWAPVPLRSDGPFLPHRAADAGRSFRPLLLETLRAQHRLPHQTRQLGGLDADGTPKWAGPEVTADEWFFITTLYGEMTLEGQRTHIRAFFPRFVAATDRDIRNVTSELVADWKLRSDWMKNRLVRMAAVLRQRGESMTEHVEHLRKLERRTTPANPMPALDAIIADHQATGWKTFSVFVRDCVGGNSFPIDSRVEKELERHGLSNAERQLMSLSLALGRNPRRVARMFF